MFVVLVHYTSNIEKIDMHLKAHRIFLDKAYEKNLLLCSGPQIPRTGGIIISHIKERTILENLLQQDPFSQENIAEYTIIEFDPIKCHAQLHNILHA